MGRRGHTQSGHDVGGSKYIIPWQLRRLAGKYKVKPAKPKSLLIKDRFCKLVTCGQKLKKYTPTGKIYKSEYCHTVCCNNERVRRLREIKQNGRKNNKSTGAK